MRKNSIILAAAVVALLAFTACTKEKTAITSFEECAAAGNPVMESYPRQCAADGRTFTENLAEVPAIGGERDEHGCLTSAGYSWSESIGACARAWELNEDQVRAAKIALASVEQSQSTTIVEVSILRCPGCYVVKLEQGSERTPVNVRLSEWRILGLGQAMPAACTKEYVPVCGKIPVQCVTTPCDPIATTFGNRCEAEAAGALDIQEGTCKEENSNPEGACLSFDGSWDAEHKECVGMGKEQCEELGGTFNECASACRHDPDAQVCTMQCVILCSFE